MGDSEINTNAESFDIQKELYTLAAKNIIPKKLADRLGQKLMEKNIKLTKPQLHLLVTKINNILKNSNNLGSISPSIPSSDNENMQKLIETIEKLEERITNIESGNNSWRDGAENYGETLEVPGTEPTNITKTSDISVNENIKVRTTQDWNVQPLQKVPNDPESIIVLMKWLQYLIDKCGRDNLSNILDYYVDIGWVSQDAKISLLDYSNGIKEEKTGDSSATGRNITDLPSKDHIQSFVYIQKLKGKQLDKHFIDRIDGELNRIMKKLGNYSFK